MTSAVVCQIYDLGDSRFANANWSCRLWQQYSRLRTPSAIAQHSRNSIRVPSTISANPFHLAPWSLPWCKSGKLFMRCWPTGPHLFARVVLKAWWSSSDKQDVLRVRARTYCGYVCCC
eukprot:s3948_g5.t2